MNVEPKQIIKKDSLISKKKEKKAQEIRKKKQWKDLQRHENVRSKMKMTLEIKTKLKV